MNPFINKLLIALAGAIAMVAVVSGDGFTTQEIIEVVVGFLTALGVYVVPNSALK